jgi:hypothetical protein
MKKLRILTVALIVLAFTNISVGQCKYSLNEKDKFTGVLKIETSSEILHRDFNSAISFSFCKYDSLYFVKVGLNLTDKIYSIVKGDKLMLICGSTTVTLQSLDTKVVQEFVYMDYIITKEQLSNLNQFKISDIRIYLRDSYIEKKVLVKRAEKIMQLSNCVKY